jgi:hypothetical protein
LNATIELTHVKRRTYGNAIDAAAVLDRSISQFNEVRRRNTFVFNPATGRLERLSGDNYKAVPIRDMHLVAPSLAGQRLPGGVWEYDLERLRRIRAGDLSAAGLPSQPRNREFGFDESVPIPNAPE